MAEAFPVRKYIKVWTRRRKNNLKKDRTRTVSYTLEWLEFGRRRFLSLGKHATWAYARQAAAQKEKELNSLARVEALEPIMWDDFCKKYLDTIYPGHGLPPTERKEAVRNWNKSLKTMKREKLSMDNFGRIIKPYWCHEITAEDREKFIQRRLQEVGSAVSVDAELRSIRLFCNVMEEWRHRSENSNPFAGRGKVTVGLRRKRTKEREREGVKPAYYTIPQLVRLLDQADREVEEKPDDWNRRRLQALVYFEAYTGARINEVLHLAWDDIDWHNGVAYLFFKIENDLKTEGSEAPFGLPDALIPILQDWKRYGTGPWVFPNSEGKPWTSGGPGYKPLDQLKALAKRAGIEHATWKMFRHSFDTHGKGRFGMTKEQMRAHLRHTTDQTQKHYDHADLENLREAVKEIDFRRTVNAASASEAPPPP